MKHKISISKNDADEASHHGETKIEKDSRIQRILIASAGICVGIGAISYFLKGYDPLFPLTAYISGFAWAFCVLLMAIVCIVDFKKLK
jgi:hypothetical protein